MTKLNAKTALAAFLALAALTAAAPAGAAQLRHRNAEPSYETRPAGPGYYEGQYEYNVDRNDRASSPYSGF